LVDVLGCLKHKVSLNEPRPIGPLGTTYEKNRQIRKFVAEAKDRSGSGPTNLFKLTGAYCE